MAMPNGQEHRLHTQELKGSTERKVLSIEDETYTTSQGLADRHTYLTEEWGSVMPGRGDDIREIEYEGRASLVDTSRL